MFCSRDENNVRHKQSEFRFNTVINIIYILNITIINIMKFLSVEFPSAHIY